jgi:di/tricarboxylate transporter
VIDERTLVFLILGATILLFVSDRLRLDVVALLALLALALSGILTPAEALAGFSDPIVILIAGLFVVGGALFETGVAARMGHLLAGFAGTNPLRLTAVVMLSAGLLSGFMSSTGTVAVMLPVVAAMAWKAGISPSKLLIPLSFGSLLGGMLTLIGTAPNIVVSNQLAAEGYAPLGFFDFTPVGAVMLLAGVGFMLLGGIRLLPSRASAAGPEAPDGVPEIAPDELVRGYDIGEIVRARVPAGSTLIGRTAAEADLRRRFQVDLVRLRHHRGRPFAGSRRAGLIGEGDVLDLRGEPSAIERLVTEHSLEDFREPDPGMRLELAEVLLTPRSRLIGQSLAGVKFRDRYGVQVLAVSRGAEHVRGELAELPLRFGDTLLVSGPRRRIDLLRGEGRDFVVVARGQSSLGERRLGGRAHIALGIMVGMMLLLTFEIVAPVVAVLLAAVAAVLTRSIAVDDAYRAINWESVVLIAAILPMATALEKTGGMQLIIDGLGGVGAYGPIAMTAVLFVITTTFSQVISNTTTTVLIAPIAFGAAIQMGVSPYPMLMTVAVAASTAFATPIATPVNTLVLGPGAYRFSDFFRVGALLQAVIFLLTIAVVPLLFPF